MPDKNDLQEVQLDLMDTLDKNTKLAGAVLAVGDRARREGFADGWQKRGGANAFESAASVVLAFILGVVSAAAFFTLL